MAPEAAPSLLLCLLGVTHEEAEDFSMSFRDTATLGGVVYFLISALDFVTNTPQLFSFQATLNASFYFSDPVYASTYGCSLPGKDAIFS